MKPWHLFLILVFNVLVMAGCSTTPKVDWNARVGNYTHDQAVTELGPPERSSKLEDGSRVSEWLVGRGTSSRVGFGVGTGFSSGGVGVGVGQSFGPPPRNKYLQLTFDVDGKLAKWTHVER